MSRLLTLTQAARQIRISVGTLREMMRNGQFPPPIRRNKRWVRVPEQDVKDYLARLDAERREQQPQPA
jgi:excisionase family DNA binding protein